MKSVTMFRRYKNRDGLEVELPEEIFEGIKKQIARFYPRECGGIFVGKIDKGNIAVIEEMMVPKGFWSTSVLFKRLAGFLNKWLDRVFKQSAGETIYLGEWHSHPDASPVPSLTDFTTMRRIAANTDTRIQ